MSLRFVLAILFDRWVTLQPFFFSCWCVFCGIKSFEPWNISFWCNLIYPISACSEIWLILRNSIDQEWKKRDNKILQMSRDMTKLTKWLCAQRRLICPVWSESSLCAQWVAKDPSFLHAVSEDWSDWADAQADLSLRWAHSHFAGFVMRRLKLH